ncbi:MAG TPA: hypothetical protein VHE35_27825 [Kofleriaceae bacterium]|nr:hypothetical protein [Kofleriaceae bacterium]
MRAAALAALGVGLGLAACGAHAARPAATAPLASRGSVDPVARLLAFVPAGATFVLVRDQHAGELDPFGGRQAMQLVSASRTLLDDQADPAQAFVAAILDQVLATPAAAGEVVGWHEGESIAVLYGAGADTVLRATLDGARLRALLERTAARTGYTLPLASWQGRPYYRIDLSVRAGLSIVVLLDDHGLAAALTDDPDHAIEQLAADHLDGPRLDVAPAMAAVFPDHEADARFSGAFYPDRLAVALSWAAARHPGWPGACARALGGLLRATPSAFVGWRGTASHFETVMLLDVSDHALDRLEHAARRIPRWSRTSPDLQVGVGMSPRTLLEVGEPWFAAFDALGAGCGVGGGGAVAGLKQALALAPMAHIDALSVDFDPEKKTMAAAIAARDQAALWASIRTLLPTLRPQPPAPLEQITQQLSFPSLVFHGGTDALGVGTSVGTLDEAGAAVGAFMASAPGPDALFAVDFGRAFIDLMKQTSGVQDVPRTVTQFSLHARLRDRRVRIEMTVGLSAPPRGPLVH